MLERSDEAEVVRGKSQTRQHYIVADLLRRRQLQDLRQAKRASGEPDVVFAAPLGIAAGALLVRGVLRLPAAVCHLVRGRDVANARGYHVVELLAGLPVEVAAQDHGAAVRALALEALDEFDQRGGLLPPNLGGLGVISAGLEVRRDEEHGGPARNLPVSEQRPGRGAVCLLPVLLQEDLEPSFLNVETGLLGGNSI